MKGDGTITKPLADKALAMLDVDALGLDVMDRKLLEAGDPPLRRRPGRARQRRRGDRRERDTIEDVIEPFLIQQGFCSARRAAGGDAGRVPTSGVAPPPKSAATACSPKAPEEPVNSH